MTLLDHPKSRLLTVDEFLEHPECDNFELVNGVLTERKPMGALSDSIAMRIVGFLAMFREAIGGGHIFGPETIYRCFGSKRTGRKGDVSFIRKGRFPNEQVPDGAVDIAADLIVEVVSPSDLAYSVEAKAKLYLENGFGELWVVFPNTRTVHVRRPGEAGRILSVSDTITGTGALAGFSRPVRDFFEA